ncbi:MAG: GGDEF domain-containing protein, partial [Firmicutes bacterium]|nr:GGDEF domain-containing protein [Bacillota bacterium]
MAIAAGFTLLPFGIYRLIHSDWFQAAVDLGTETLILSLTIFAWRTGKVQQACRILIYTNSLAVIASSHQLGLAGVLWLYPIIVANFFLVNRHQALVASLLLLFGVITVGRGIHDFLAMASLIAAALAAISVVYTFAYRVSVQREQLETLAALDALTGLFNRRIFQEECERHRQAMAREGTPCGLLVMDLDHFKS